MKISLKALPQYTRSEEIWNASTHFAGSLIGIAITIFFLIYQIVRKIPFNIMWPFYLYSFAMIFMFTMSGVYHSRKYDSQKRAIFRIIDHCDIYFFITATYIPICLYALNNRSVGVIAIIINSIINLVAIIINIINIDSKIIKTISIILYILSGWMIILVLPFNVHINIKVLSFLLAGGISFTIGSVLYGIGHHKKWFHTIFHFFVLVGVILQFVAVVLVLFI